MQAHFYRKYLILFCCAAIWFGIVPAHSAEMRLAIDPQVQLDDLARTGLIAVRTDHSGSDYSADASAVLSVPMDALARASLDYDHYVQMRMPDLDQCVTVAITGDTRVIWSEMNAFGLLDDHYLEVHLHADLPGGGQGTDWQQVHPAPGSAWNKPDDSAFSRLEGSWFMQPLPSGKIYVRYFLFADPDVEVPDLLLSAFIRRSFGNGVQDVIRALAHEAAIRQ